MDVATGNARQLTKDVTAIGSKLQWSPKGDRVALFGTAKKDYWYLDLADIFLVDAKSGATTKVKMAPFVTAYQHRDLLVAGRRPFLFRLSAARRAYIWSIPAQGGAATRVSHLGGVIGGFDATAARDAFVFARSSETEGSDIYYLPALGGPERRLHTTRHAMGRSARADRSGLPELRRPVHSGLPLSACRDQLRTALSRRWCKCTAAAATRTCAGRT